MTTARQIIQLALESMNRLSPGEVIDADLAAICMRQLNVIADSMSAGRTDLFKDQLTSGTASGPSLTLGSGSFASIAPGTEIQGMTADGYRMSQITFAQYRDHADKTSTGRPTEYAYDGLDTVYLLPLATGNQIAIQTRASIAQFADLDTGYIFPPGYISAFYTSLAVSLSPSLLGGDSPKLEKAEKVAMLGIEKANMLPAIVSGGTY